jgi:Tfp pilus assembly major pilin PilA
MFCQKCGNKLIEGAEVCPNCGTRVVGPGGKPATSGSKTAMIVLGVAVGCFGLIIVMGILAAIAIPKFANTKERAYVAMMKGDLRNLVTAQETYFSDNKSYATSVGALGTSYRLQTGVTIQLGDVTKTGWQATASYPATTKTCMISLGGGSTSEGVPICQ